MEVNKYKRKFKLLFDKFFQENFELNAYHAENLLKYLEDCPDKSAEKIMDTPFFSDLIIYSLSNIENASNSVKLFITEVVTLVFKNELQFSKMLQLHGMDMIAEKFYKDSDNPDRMLPIRNELAGMKLVNAVISHYSGVNWCIQYKIWEQLLTKSHMRATLSKAIYEFIGKFVWKLNEYDEEAVLVEVLQFITEPIKASGYLDSEVISVEREKEICNRVNAYLNSLLAIVSDYQIFSKNKVLPLLIGHCVVEPALHLMLDMTRDQNVARLVSDITFRLIVAMIKDGACKSNNLYEITVAYYNIVNSLLKKRMVDATLDFIVKCNVIWFKVSTDTVQTFERYGRTFDLRNQFLTPILVPLLSYTFKVNTEIHKKRDTKILDVYAIKLSAIITEHVVKAGYTFRGVIAETDVTKTAIQAIRELFKLKGTLNEMQAGLIYQALYYMLQVNVLSDGMGGLILNETPLKTPDDLKVMSLTFEAIKMLLKEHNINWYDSLEIICLQACLMNLLKQNILPSKHILQVIDLIDLSIKKFLSPDLALLMESKSGSTLNEIGALMVSYIQHDEWEIRDSTLQLLLSCTDVAYIKYIPLQKLISGNRLSVLAAHAALNDTEYYVQMTALKCLAAATKIDIIWREVITVHPNLYVQLIHIMKNHSEGIVRKEALNVLTEVYVNKKVSKNFTKCMYDVIAHAALTDLHWEVQISALNFWKQAIRQNLADRGMIDGKFPVMTFSKEKRKIITLDANEIQKQLTSVLNELSLSGCLAVLHQCMNNELNVEVIEQAYCISKELIKILDRYKFESIPEDNFPDNIVISSPVTIPIINLADIKPDISDNLAILFHQQQMDRILQYNMNYRDQVIETIVNTNQSDLIFELFENNARVYSEPMDEDCSEFYLNSDTLPCDTLHPNVFLKSFRETDYLSIIEEKKNWFAGSCNLDALLDDILILGEERRDFVEECTD